MAVVESVKVIGSMPFAVRIEQFGSVVIPPAFTPKFRCMLPTEVPGPEMAPTNGNVTLLLPFVNVIGPDIGPAGARTASQRTAIGARPSGRDSVPVHVPERVLPLGLVGLPDPDPDPDPPQLTAKVNAQLATAIVKTLAEGHELERIGPPEGCSISEALTGTRSCSPRTGYYYRSCHSSRRFE
jgi:hypothetical protein